MTSKTLWRSGFDRLERAAGAPLGRFVQTRSFGKTVTALVHVQSFTRDSVERGLSQRWHLANLPARTDVARLRAQVSQLDRQLRVLESAEDG